MQQHNRDKTAVRLKQWFAVVFLWVTAGDFRDDSVTAVSSTPALIRNVSRAVYNLFYKAVKKDSYHILIDEVLYHVCKTRVTPVAMNQQQLAEVFKPWNSKVTGHHGLEKDLKQQKMTTEQNNEKKKKKKRKR